MTMQQVGANQRAILNFPRICVWSEVSIFRFAESRSDLVTLQSLHDVNVVFYF